MNIAVLFFNGFYLTSFSFASYFKSCHSNTIHKHKAIECNSCAALKKKNVHKHCTKIHVQLLWLFLHICFTLLYSRQHNNNNNNNTINITTTTVVALTPRWKTLRGNVLQTVYKLNQFLDKFSAVFLCLYFLCHRFFNLISYTSN